MTELPYTNDDLRAEAARQLATSMEDPDFMGIGERMEYAAVPSTDDGTTSLTWSELLVAEDGGSYEAFGEAQRAIGGLLNKAADVSEWAVNIGADGLEPAARAIDIGWNDGPLQARLHIAFTADVPPEEREQILSDISDAIAGTVPVR